MLTCTGHWSFVPRNSAAFLVSSKGNPMDVWTRGGTCSLDTIIPRTETVTECTEIKS